MSLVRDEQTGLNAGIKLHLEPRKSESSRSRNGARVYLADRCTEGRYNPRDYAHLHLLNRTLSFTVDLSAPVACGCNAAFYLGELYSNNEPGACDGDYYCDAASVCGVKCFEYDLMEANQQTFQSTFHLSTDHGGGVAWGLSKQAASSISARDYGPNGAVVSTAHPFRVHTFFQPDASGHQLSAVETTLQGHRGSISFRHDWERRESFFAAANRPIDVVGLTPVLSYWSSDKLGGWFDGSTCYLVSEKGEYSQDNCADAVTFSDIGLRPGHPGTAHRTPYTVPSPAPAPTSPRTRLAPPTVGTPPPKRSPPSSSSPTTPLSPAKDYDTKITTAPARGHMSESASPPLLPPAQLGTPPDTHDAPPATSPAPQTAASAQERYSSVLPASALQRQSSHTSLLPAGSEGVARGTDYVADCTIAVAVVVLLVLGVYYHARGVASCRLKHTSRREYHLRVPVEEQQHEL